MYKRWQKCHTSDSATDISSTSQQSSNNDSELNTLVCSNIDSVMLHQHCTASNSDNSRIYSSCDDEMSLDSSDKIPSDSNVEVSLDCNDEEFLKSTPENSTAPIFFDLLLCYNS